MANRNRKSSISVALGLDVKPHKAGNSSNALSPTARMDTNSKLTETIEKALRDSWDARAAKKNEYLSKEVNGDSIFAKNKRLATLYGLSPLSPHVVKRSHTLKKITSPKRNHAEHFFSITSNQQDDDASSVHSGSVGSTSNEVKAALVRSKTIKGLSFGSNEPSNEIEESNKLSGKDVEKSVSFNLNYKHEDGYENLPGWYCGYTNAVPDTLPLHASEMRYGKRGSLRMNTRMMFRAGVSDPRLIDWQRRAWTPKLEGSPHIWDSNADYVSGSILKEEPLNPEPCSRLYRTLKHDLLERERKREELKQESLLASAIQVNLGNTQANRNAHPPKINEITTFQKNLKYWENFTLISKDKDTSKSIKIAAEREILDKEYREKEKWGRLMHLYFVMRLPGYRSASLRDVQVLYIEFMKKAEENINPIYISREQFLFVLQGIYGREIKVWDMNRLYSSFDIDKLDSIDFRHFVSTIRILRMASEKPIDKLIALFPLFDLNDEDAISYTDLIKLLQTCSITTEEKKTMINFAKDFIDNDHIVHESNAKGKKRASMAFKESLVRIGKETFMKKIKINTSLVSEFREQMYKRLPENILDEIKRTTIKL